MSTAPPPREDNPADIKALDLLYASMMALNMIDPDNEHGGDVRYASPSEGEPYWHLEQATRKAAAHLVGGNQRRAEELVQAMVVNGMDARWTLAMLREQWAGDDPVGEALARMIFQTDMNAEADVVRWAAARAGFMWRCPNPCGYFTVSSVDECDRCGTARKTLA